MSEPWGLYLADALAIAGTAAMTLALTGLARFPDHFAQLHSASKALVLGTLVVLACSIGTGEVDVVLRAALVGAFLLLTYPVGTYALAAREWRERDRRAPPRGSPFPKSRSAGTR